MLADVSDNNVREGALEADEDERVRHFVQQLVRETGSQAAASRKIGVSQQTVSRHLNGFPAGKLFASKVAEVFNLSLRQLLRGDEDDVQPDRPIFGKLPGWADAEAIARRRFKYVPEEAWLAIRELSGARVPDVVTPEWVGQLATLYASALRGEGEDVDPD